jgi:UDP-N-acetylmuramoyl-L-alanyl-D-glutamate--2,6-diaminopimelate ligase
MRIRQLIKSLNINVNGLKDFEVRGISCNSKEVKKDFVFVAIKGAKEDGHNFINEAIRNGARLVITQDFLPQNSKATFINFKDTRKILARLASEFYSRPSEKLKVAGITGTNGKTTVTYIIEAILKAAGFYPGVLGTINYRFKNRLILAKNTTPGPIELQNILSQMSKEGVDYCIMEVSSHALDQNRIEEIEFHSAIFTNLTQDHLDYHQNLENYFKAKSKLFKMLDKNSFAVINNDDKWVRRIKDLTRAEIITYGIKNNALVRAKQIKFNCLSTEFLLSSRKIEFSLKTKLLGEHNIYNILAAVAWALKEGIDTDVIKSSLEKFSSVPGRLERIDSNRDFQVFVDYAHTEDALKNIIRTLRQVYNKRIIVVFGCGGERDKVKRPKMGRVVTELSDLAIITNDNPRSEDPRDIINDIKQGIRKKNYSVISDRAEAISKALSLAKSGDVVLVAGKGHENYQILKDRVIHFDDKEVIKGCLKSMNY